MIEHAEYAFEADYYYGVYEKTIEELKKERGIKPEEEIADYLSSEHLNYKILINEMVARSGNGHNMLLIASNFRNFYETVLGYELVPEWEDTPLTEAQARKELEA